MNTLFLKAPQLTAEIMRAHYCEHDLDKILPLFHETLTWIGAGEDQICYDYETIKDFFLRTYAEKAVPDCIITDEDYRLVSWDEHSCLVAGRCWIATKPETGYVLRAHQRVTFSYKLVDGELKITLIHISNPYADMQEGEDFPAQIGRQSYEYLQRLLVEKSRQIALLNSTVSSGLKANWDDECYSLFYVNEGLCRMLGYTEEELMAKCRGRMTELVYPPDLPQALADCERCFANSLTYSTEYRMQRKDGKLIWVWDTGSKSKNEEGKTVINSVIVDITERRHTNDTIRRQKAFFQSLYDTTLCALVQYDLNGTFLNANAFTFDVIGYTEEQFRTETGGSLMSIVHPCDVDTVREHIERLIADRRPTVYNCRIIRRDGAVRWVCASANIINNMDGVPVIQAAYSDVTELQRVERERDSTYDSIPGGVAKVLIGTQLSLLEANDNFFQMLGTDRTAYKGTLSAVAPADRGAIVTAFMEAAETDAPVDIEYRCRRFDNEQTIWIHLIARFVENAHGAKVYQCVFIDITKQKTAQIQLYRERDRYRIIMENSADVIYEYDRKTDTVVFYETIRRGDETEIAKHVSPNFSKKLYDQKIAHPEDAETAMRVFSGTQGGSAEVRLRNLKINGDYVWCLLQGQPVYENGALARVVGIIRDITENKRISQEKERLQRIFDLELRRDYESICQINPSTGRYVMWTPSNASYYDIPTSGIFSEELAHAISRIVCGEDQETCLKTLSIGNMLKTLEEEKEGTCYYRVLTPDGSLRWKCARYTYFGDDGSILLNVRDVHDIRIAQQQEENRFRAILRETCEYIIETDVETKSYTLHLPTLINRYPLEACSDYGSLIARYSERYVAPEDRESFLRAVSLPEALSRMRREGGSCSIKYTVNTNGSPAYKTWNMSLYRYDDNREYMLSYILDITKLVLEQQEKEREAERNRQIIKDALTAAEQASRAKSDFLSRMSHEIRTPMNAVIGMTTIAAASLDNRDKLTDCLGKIGLSSRYLLSLINDILDMSRIESGKVSIINEEFDFRSFVEGISSLIYPQAKNKNIVFDLNIEGVVDERYRGDPLRLNQVLINILSNALKFTPEWRSVHLSIRETRRVRDRAYLQFIVRDTGIGMEKGLLERIFEPFEQGGASISHSYGGSGLGLAISSNLISLMNGHISVSSTPGVGSEFVVELPLLTVPDNTPKQDVSLEDIRVLVVDDDLVTCEHTTLILNRIGVDAEYVTSGKAAVTRVKSALQRHTCYNIALVDWKMPDMDGVETARSIRRIVGPDTLVIIMSAYDWTEIEARAREAGVDFFISKPIFQSVVQDVLLKATRRRQSADTLPVQKEDFAGRRILLVEDNEINMEIARTLLEFRNASVDGACNGQQAVEMFRSSPQNHYDAVLMDVRMPVMDGIAATQAIRGLDRADAATVPILAMTANAFAEDIERSRKAGMNEHLAKPIEPETLYARLASYFR
ncbi:PAS domain-containing protein [Bilophila wadsworthia]|uniref:PAS domain-containing hybrid sensor histidine kinase/response regulator n=1 Tax=Bilophila wadsworthia TaxID=35833 RepID=UPI001D09CBAC|nr:PAS domain-containing protein [Bilophila wadsworthia]MCB8569703.1 PAS domain-containing protein [Bilophila wadsworthia]MCC2713586.1 PAS domain-containing protein [Bilophila wadsworthia]